MKSKGKTAWLITWEGSEFEHLGRCKIVAILPPNNGKSTVQFMMRHLYCSDYTLTLCEKLYFSTVRGNDPLFRQTYRDVNPELIYGVYAKIYLCARHVKNLRCEESRKDCFESTLYWTELPKYIQNPEWNPNDPLPNDLAVLTKQIRGEIEASYTYSTRSSIEEEKVRIFNSQSSIPK